MSEPPREFFTGTSLEQAVLLAAQHYGVEPDDLAYERVERRYGFLRQRRNVVIKVDPKRPVRKYRVGDEQPVIVEPEIDETPQLETQKDFNLHRDPPPPSLAHRTQRPPAQRQPGQRDGGGQRGPGARGQRPPGWSAPAGGAGRSTGSAGRAPAASDVAWRRRRRRRRAS